MPRNDFRRAPDDRDADAGDHAEHALGADHQLAKVGARRGLGCPGPGSSVPAGVTIRRPLTLSSKRPYPADSCPLERVAANPPMVAYWHHWGKCAEGVTTRRRAGARPRAGNPAPSTATPDTSSSPVQSVQPAQVERYHGRELAAPRIGPPRRCHRRTGRQRCRAARTSGGWRRSGLRRRAAARRPARPEHRDPVCEAGRAWTCRPRAAAWRRRRRRSDRCRRSRSARRGRRVTARTAAA